MIETTLSLPTSNQWLAHVTRWCIYLHIGTDHSWWGSSSSKNSFRSSSSSSKEITSSKKLVFFTNYLAKLLLLYSTMGGVWGKCQSPYTLRPNCSWNKFSERCATCWNQTAFSERWEGATRRVSCCVWMCEHKDLLGTRRVRRWGERATWLRSHGKLVFRFRLQQSSDSLRGAVFRRAFPRAPARSRSHWRVLPNRHLGYVWFAA